MRLLFGAYSVQKQSRLFGYRPGDPGDDRVPCVLNEIGYADPHTKHKKYIISQGKVPCLDTKIQFRFKTHISLPVEQLVMISLHRIS